MTQETIPVACPRCQAGMGEMVNVNGNIYLDAGGWLIVAGFCFCHRCGRRFTFSPPRQTWDQLLTRRN